MSQGELDRWDVERGDRAAQAFLCWTTPSSCAPASPPADCSCPGGRAGQPLTPGALRQRFQALGLPTIPARTAALSQLVLRAPAPVIAAALGHRDGTAERHRLGGGGTWSRYTALPR